MAYWSLWWKGGNMEKKSNWPQMTILIFARHLKLRNLGLLVDILLFLNVVNHFLPRYRTVSQYLCRCDALFRSYRVIDQIHYMAALTEKDVIYLWCNATAWYIFSCIERNLFYHCSIMITHVPLIYDHISGYQGHQSTWSHCNFHLRLRVLSCHLLAPVFRCAKHLYKRVCPSVRPSVRPSVGPSVRP